MTKSALIQARIEPTLKREGEEVLSKLGLSASELVTMTYRQLVMRRGLPFEVSIPNEKTIATFEDTNDQGKTFETVQSAMSWLNAEDVTESDT